MSSAEWSLGNDTDGVVEMAGRLRIVRWHIEELIGEFGRALGEDSTTRLSTEASL